MSKNLIKFLESIHVSNDLIQKLQSEDDIEDVEVLGKSYLDSRNTYYEGTHLKDKISQTRKETVSAYNIKVMKQINELLGMGLTNSQIEEYKDKDLEVFVGKSKEFKSSYEEKLKSNTDETLRKELDQYKITATERQRKIDELVSGMDTAIARADAEKENAIREFKAKQYWNKMIIEDAEIADVPGKSFALESIEERIFSKYIVDENGNITNHDGSVATHPEKEIAIKHISEIYPYFKDKAGLMKKSNAGGGGEGFYKSPDGKMVPKGDLPQAAIDKMKEFAAMKK